MTDRPVPFVILAPGRSGSNLLRGLLQSCPEIVVGGEVLNRGFVERAGVPWPLDGREKDPEWLRLMAEQPVEYLQRLYDAARRDGVRAIGCKFMYGQFGIRAVTDYLAADTDIRVLHLTRRNLLRQYLSLQRANATGAWGSKQKVALPALELEFLDCVQYFLRMEQHHAEVRRRFAGHPMLALTYEELAADPLGVGERAVRFLGVEPEGRLHVRSKKTGTDPLREAIVNYDELRARFAEWVEFFE